MPEHLDEQPSDHYLAQPCEDCGGRRRVRALVLTRETPLRVPTLAAMRRCCLDCTQRRLDQFLAALPEVPAPPPPGPLADDGREEP